MTHALLKTLRDVPGVEGSFLLDETGRLLARDASALYSDDVLEVSGHRIATLAAAADETIARSDTLILDYDGFTLLVRSAVALRLVTMVRTGTNVQALQMATTLLLRRLAAEARAPRSLPAAPAPPLAPAGSFPPRVSSGPAPTSGAPSRSPRGERRNATAPRKKLRKGKGIWG